MIYRCIITSQTNWIIKSCKGMMAVQLEYSHSNIRLTCMHNEYTPVPHENLSNITQTIMVTLKQKVTIYNSTIFVSQPTPELFLQVYAIMVKT